MVLGRAHAKGVCLQGEFVSSGLLAPYSTSVFFQPGTQPFVGRFSIAGGDPLHRIWQHPCVV